MHADSRLPKGYACDVFNVLMDSQTVLGAFQFKTDIDNISMMKLFELGTNIRAAFFKLPYGDQALFVRKSTFMKTGGFPMVPIAEDLFFVRNMKKLGRLRIAPAAVVTSGRRWRNIGILRTFAVNQIIMTGCLLGVSPEQLAPLYNISKKQGRF